MRHFAKLLKDMLVATERQCPPATESEVAVHDRPRIDPDCVQTGGNTALARSTPRHINVCRYRSESDLHDLWRCFDGTDRQAANLTVILALDEFLRGNLREVVRRRQPAYRLILVPRAGHWPGLDSFGDLALTKDVLGWSLIEIHRDLDEALETTILATGQHEPLLVVLPTDTHNCRLM